jgi:hypothetical protein
MNLQLVLREKSATFLPGAQVEGEALLLHTGQWTALHVDVVLFWRTQGRGNRDEATAAVANLARFEQKMPSSFSQQFSFTLPQHPWTYLGRMLKVRWYIGLYVAGDDKIDAELEMPILVHPQPVRFEGWNVEG